jgi:hypothetical protein
MPKKGELVKEDTNEDVKEDKEDLHREDNVDYYDETEGSHQHHHYHYKNALWMSDISDDFYDLLNYYSEIDDRLKWVNMTDILYGRRSNYKLSYDSDINEFIDKFLDEIDYLLSFMKRKKHHIIEDDCDDFERLISLNREIIYSRIAFCLQKWYII